MLNYLANINLMYTVTNDKLVTFLVRKATESEVKCMNQATANYLADLVDIMDEVRRDITSAEQVQPTDLINIDQDDEQDIRFV